jgi:hypothetical protein
MKPLIVLFAIVLLIVLLFYIWSLKSTKIAIVHIKHHLRLYRLKVKQYEKREEKEAKHLTFRFKLWIMTMLYQKEWYVKELERKLYNHLIKLEEMIRTDQDHEDIIKKFNEAKLVFHELTSIEKHDKIMVAYSIIKKAYEKVKSELKEKHIEDKNNDEKEDYQKE